MRIVREDKGFNYLGKYGEYLFFNKNVEGHTGEIVCVEKKAYYVRRDDSTICLTATKDMADTISLEIFQRRAQRDVVLNQECKLSTL